MTDACTPPSHLIDELRAVLASLEHARRRLGDGDIMDAEALRCRLEDCAHRIDALDRSGREAARPLMLALMDELARTIAAFGTEHRDLGDRLRSASRSLTADTAYRQAGKG